MYVDIQLLFRTFHEKFHSIFGVKLFGFLVDYFSYKLFSS